MVQRIRGHGRTIKRKDGRDLVNFAIDDFEFLRFTDEEDTDRMGYRAPPVPEPPKVPDARELRASFSETHSRHHRRYGIRLPTLDAVKNAIIAYGQGVGALAKTASDMGEAGGINGVLLLAVDAGRDRGPFLRRIFDKLDEAFAPGGKDIYAADWDYDGPGAFHKSGVKVTREGDGFLLHFWGAYRDDRDERLAEDLGLEAEYVCAEHRLTFPSDGPRFRIPPEFFAKLGRALGIVSDLFPDRFAEGLAKLSQELSERDPYGENKGPTTIDHDEGRGFTVSVALSDTRAMWPHKLRVARSRAEGRPEELAAFEFRAEPDGSVSGPARRYDQYDPHLFGAVGVEVRIRPKTRDDVARAISASDRLAAEFAGLPPAYADGS